MRTLPPAFLISDEMIFEHRNAAQLIGSAGRIADGGR
jgi:hypothetical protein